MRIVPLVTILGLLCATAWAKTRNVIPESAKGAGNGSPSPTLMPAAAIFTAKGGNPPIILNATSTAQGGDIVTMQGHNFGDSPTVQMVRAGAPDLVLPLVNRVGDWLAVKIPADTSGAIVLRIANGSNSSAAVVMNAARGYHLDALQIVPQGKFRIFGRNLQLASKTSSVTVDGLAAQVDATQSSEHMLVVTAPKDLTDKANAVVTVDNGNGSGRSAVERTVKVVTGVTISPFDYSVGWTAAFRPLTAHVVELPCRGGQIMSEQIQAAVNAFGAEGGIVQLTAGSCALTSGIGLRSNVVLQGQGKGVTTLTYYGNYPVAAAGLSRVGLRNLTLTNGGSAQEGPLIKDSDLVILQNVRMNFGRQRQSFFDGNRNILVTGCDFFQTASINQQSPYLFSGSKGLIFTNNSTTFVMGAAAFERVSDAYIQGNIFTRDAAAQNDAGTLHMLTLDFASRVAIMGNTFNTINGAITNKTRNDGEALLTEGGGGNRTENLGTVASAGTRTIYDSSLRLDTDPFRTGIMPENYGIAIVGGKGTGQTRYITAFSGGTVTVDRDWDVVPDSSSKYATFVWGLEKSVLEGNDFRGMPRGIWLYQTALRDVDVTGNRFSESGGIYLRAYQKLDNKMFDPIYNVRIAGNIVSNSTGNWLSYMTAVFVNNDARAFGMAMTGIEFRNNALTANVPNLSSAWEEYAGSEGYMNMMRVENYERYEAMTTPRLLGTIFQDNSCSHCAVAYRIGTGAGGTVFSGATNIDVGLVIDDWKTTIAQDRATDTAFR